MLEELKNLIGMIGGYLGGLFVSAGDSADGQALDRVRNRDLNGYAAPALALGGTAEITTKLNENVIASITGDIRPDGRSFVVKSLAAKKPDGGEYSALIIPERPVVLALDAQGQIKLNDAKLQESLKRLDRRILEDMTEREQPITVSAKNVQEGKSHFTFIVKSGKSSNVYEGEVGADRKARITGFGSFDGNGQTRFSGGRDKVTLSPPISVSLSPENNLAIMISSQKLWEIASSAFEQVDEESKTEALITQLSHAYHKGEFQDIPLGGHAVAGIARTIRNRGMS